MIIILFIFLAVSYDLLSKIDSNDPASLHLAKVGYHLAQQFAENFNPLKVQKMFSTLPSSYKDLVTIMRDLMDSQKKRTFHQIIYYFNGTLSTNSRIVENTAFRLLTDVVKYEPNISLPFINSSEITEQKLFYIAIAQGKIN